MTKINKKHTKCVNIYNNTSRMEAYSFSTIAHNFRRINTTLQQWLLV